MPVHKTDVCLHQPRQICRGRLGWWLLSLFVFAVSAGCGNSDRLPTFETTGTVTYIDGKPIEEGTLLFYAEGFPTGRALIDDGQYTVGTYEETDGAVAARFKIGVTANPPADYDPDAGRPPLGPKPKYARPDTSGLEFEVTPDGENRFDIVLERGR